MKYIFLILLWSTMHFAYAQKKMLQLDSYQSWQKVSRARISDNGQFVWYKIHNQPVGSTTYVAHAVATGKETKFHATEEPVFSTKNNFLFVKAKKDSLLIIDLNLFSISFFASANSFQLFTTGKDEAIATLNSEGSLNFTKLEAKKTLRFFNCDSVIDYKIAPDGLSAVIQQKTKQNDIVNLLWVNLKTCKAKTLYSGFPINNPVFDANGKQIAFLVNHDNRNVIWYGNETDKKAIKLLDENSPDLLGLLSIQPGQCWGFNWNKKELYFSLKSPRAPSKFSNPNLTIWNYQDPYLPTDISNPNNPDNQTTDYLSVINIESKNITRLLHEGESISGIFTPNRDKFLLIETNTGRFDEAEWNIKARISYSLLNLITGKVALIKQQSVSQLMYLTLSPHDKYITFYDFEFGKYFSFNISTGKTNSIYTDSLAVLDGMDIRRLGGTCGWLPGDKGIVINENYDLLNVDPDGIRPVINLTQSVGRKNNTVFYPVNGYPETILAQDGKILLSAFNIKTKQRGLYLWNIGTKPDLGKIDFTSNYIENLEQMYLPLQPRRTDNTDAFQKAKQATTYLLRLEKYNESPNYFVTSDYQYYQPISNVYPERDFNFFTAELHSYTDSLGKSYQGVLYKPENFDSTRVYPIILNYYEISSNLLNYYRYAKNGSGDIDIAYLVSNGYLVFRADIKSKPGKVGEGALKSVNAAADYLAKFNWIDAQKMAIAGHSFGGFETNYIVTHSHRFAAAITAAGVSNLITSYNDLYPDIGCNRQGFIRFNSYKMHKRLADDVTGYNNNSPILFANQVTTPLLLMHNPEDGSVDFRQGRSFFIELRSLQKRAWLLSYKGNGHGISNDNHVDYYGKVKEFLDHFLLDKPTPNWMQ